MDALVEKAAAALKASGARQVYIFDLASKGKPGPGSDLDVALSGLPPEVFFRAMACPTSFHDGSYQPNGSFPLGYVPWRIISGYEVKLGYN